MTEHEVIAKKLMLAILYDNGFIDRYHSEESQVSEKWIQLIAPIAGTFFDKHPELLIDEHIEVIGTGGIIGDPDDDLDIVYKDYPDIKPLNDVLNEYYDNGCGVSDNNLIQE